MEKQKKLLFSVTKKDFDIQFFHSGGNGGQNQNKVSSACRIIHRDSGAVGVSREFRDQPQNKKAAFQRCINSPKFKTWHKLQVAKAMGMEAEIEEAVNRAMQPQNIKIEYFDPNEGN